MQTLAGRIKQKQRQRKEIIQETVIWKVIFCVLFVVVPSATTSQKETTVIFFTVGVNMFILNGTLLSPLRQTRKCPLGAWEIVAYPLWHLFWSGNDHLGMHDKNATFSVYSYICSMCANFIHGFLPQTKKKSRKQHMQKQNIQTNPSNVDPIPCSISLRPELSLQQVRSWED